MVYIDATQRTVLGPAGNTQLLQLRVAERLHPVPKAAHQLAAAPGARAFTFMHHGTVAVQVQARPVGVRAFGVNHPVVFLDRIVVHLQVVSVQGQQGFALVLVQAFRRWG